ncbi:MAG: hypothetical protein ACI9A1_000529 [Lentimonas sp.]|jgi:hypothetical protein
MMNKAVIIVLALLGCLQVSCASTPIGAPLIILKATVVDELGDPIEDADLTAGFPGFQGKGIVKNAVTDLNGFGSVKGHAHFGVNLLINKDGYYESKFWKIYVSEDPDSGELTPRTRSFDVTLRRTINPRGLIAKRKEFEIPVKGDWVGYDFEQGDWVEPYGQGQEGDLLVRYENKFLGYNVSEEKLKEIRDIMGKWSVQNGKAWTEEMERHTHGNWSGKLEVKFPSEGEGIVKVVDGYLEQSEMKMPHMAFEEGYETDAAWTGDMPRGNPVLYQGYFLRLRVVKRGDEIIEANYAKINEEPVFDPRGTISFSYYFNPDVNDRNLEFDPSKNLLKNLDSQERVKLP